MEHARPMWQCPRCARRFANDNQSHSCGRSTLKSHFAGKPLPMRHLYRLFLNQVRKSGPVLVLPEKTRIAFQVRMCFAAIQVRSSGIIGHLVLAKRHERPCFHRIDSISRRNHVHNFRLQSAADLTEEFCGFIAMSYKVGEQKHLARAAPSLTGK